MIDLSINARVRSIAVGCEPAFEGVITDVLDPGKGPRLYTIKRDGDGTYWFREWSELWPPTGDQT